MRVVTPIRYCIAAATLVAIAGAAFVRAPARPTLAPPPSPTLVSDADLMASLSANSPKATGGSVTAVRVDTKARLNSTEMPDPDIAVMLEMAKVTKWNVLVRPDPKASRLLCRLEVRETGKAALPLVEAVISHNGLPLWDKDVPEHVIVALMPIGKDIATARNVRALVGYESIYTIEEHANPFHGNGTLTPANGYDLSLPTLNHRFAPEDATKCGLAARGNLAEVPLVEVASDAGNPLCKKRVLYLTFRA